MERLRKRPLLCLQDARARFPWRADKWAKGVEGAGQLKSPGNLLGFPLLIQESNTVWSSSQGDAEGGPEVGVTSARSPQLRAGTPALLTVIPLIHPFWVFSPALAYTSCIPVIQKYRFNLSFLRWVFLQHLSYKASCHLVNIEMPKFHPKLTSIPSVVSFYSIP